MERSELESAGINFDAFKLIRKDWLGDDEVYIRVPFTELPFYFLEELKIDCEFLESRRGEHPDNVKVLIPIQGKDQGKKKRIYIVMFEDNENYPLTETPSSG